MFTYHYPCIFCGLGALAGDLLKEASDLLNEYLVQIYRTAPYEPGRLGASGAAP